MNKEKTVVEVVQDLNGQLYEKTENDNTWFSYTLDNYVEAIAFNLFTNNSFLKIELWNSENSQQVYNEETDDYEPLEKTIKRELKEVTSHLNNINQL